jgi:Cd2+/Zn2+-exporting ATPase
MGRCTLRVEGLDCPVEVAAIRGALEGKPGIASLGFDLIHGTVTLDFTDLEIEPSSVARQLSDQTGLRTTVVDVEVPGQGPVAGSAAGPAGAPLAGEFSILLRRWGPVAGAGLAWIVGVVVERLGREDPARPIFLLAVAIAAVKLLPRALRSLRSIRLDIHVLMSLAIAGALALGEWEEAAAVAFLFGLSEALEAMSLDRARNAVRQLLEIAPESAELLGPDGTRTRVPASSVRVGQHVLVRAGERVPVDGRVVAGRSSVDQKAITGESIPVLREPGEPVFAGTVNGEGTLEIEATRPLSEAVVTRVVERVRSAQRGRTPIERTLERFAAVYTPVVVVLAVLVMIVPPVLFPGSSLRYWFAQGLVVLVIACPCALVIATPVAVVSALAAAARRGVLIKGGQFLEAFGRLNVLAFDKTGTLTRGEPDVVEVVPAAGGTQNDLVRIAAALGDRGGHVLGRAIARHARELALDVPHAHDYRAVPGLGATARVGATQYHIGSHRYLDESGLCPPGFHDSLGQAEREVGTSVAVSTRSEPLGWLRLADQPRPEANEVLARLRRLGIEPVMLTGDNTATAKAVAHQLGIDEQRPELLPEEKAAAVAELQARFGPTGMVGDGVNDAPALAAATVSVALGGVSSGAALETADVVLMAEGLGGIPWLVRHSRRTAALIRANIALAVAAKLLFLVLAVLGMANLWMAILADVGVSLLVVANALRLLRDRPDRDSP